MHKGIGEKKKGGFTRRQVSSSAIILCISNVPAPTPRLGLNEASKYLTRSLDSTHSGQFKRASKS